MKATEYTFAVACVRSNETKLLTAQELNAVIGAATFEEAARRLNDRGYEIAGRDYTPALEKKLAGAWELIATLLPDRSQFDGILIENDFQNLKAAVKAFVCGTDAAHLIFAPSVFDAADIRRAVMDNDNEALPEPLRHAHRSAYRILTQTRFAQLADSVIDRAAMEWSVKLAQRADHPVMESIAQTRTACTDIKILYRCVKAGKSGSFMERCVAACDAFDKPSAIRAAGEGMESLFAFLSHTSYAGAVEALRESPAVFEKWCDDRLTELLRGCKADIDGIAPLAAFWFAAQNELRNVRIILSAKCNGAPEETVRRRVREQYV